MTYSVYHITTNPGCGELLNYGYIGITKNPELRFSQHGWKRKNTNKHLRNAIVKYKDSIKFVILADGLDYEAACLLEEMLRPEENMGWNIAKGGSVPPSPKGKERSATYRQNISKAKMGDKNPMFGKTLLFNNKHRQNLSVSAKNMKPLVCPKCGKAGKTNGMKRWHFDRCKHESIK
jgi:predicted GIY-YIG superfamily endonuclease